MALTKYTYSKDANISILEDEVLADAGITTALDHIDLIDDADPDTVDIWFVDPISGAEETALIAVVAAHANPAYPTADVVHTGVGAPNNQLGNDGDVCLDPDTLELYKKVAGNWGSSKSIDGTPVFGNCSDVVFTSPAAGEVLKFDGTDWINNTLTEAGLAAATHTHVESDITDLQSYLLDITGENLGTLADVTLTGGPAAGELLKWDGAVWINNTLVEAGIAAASHTHVEADITDLQAYLLNITGENLESLADVTLTAIATGELLKWDGVKWINNTLAQAGIAAAAHTHVEADITDLQAYLLDITGENLGSLADATLTAIASGEMLKWNGSAWINNTLAEAGIAAASHTHVEADITDLQAYLLNITAQSITNLSDVDTTGVSMGNRLEWDGSDWVAVAAGGGSVEIDNQYTGSDSDTSTTSATWVDLDSLTLTTSNTISLKYLVIANFHFDTSSNTAGCSFKLVADGVDIPYSVMHVTPGSGGDPKNVTLVGHVTLANAKVVKAQYQTDAGTCTVHNRSIVLRGIG